MITSAINKQTSLFVLCLLFYFIKSIYGISNLESWKKIILLACIADVSCLTNRSFYMRTLSLRSELLRKESQKLKNGKFILRFHCLWKMCTDIHKNSQYLQYLQKKNAILLK